MKSRILLGLFCVFALGASQAYARVVIVRNRPRVIRQDVVIVPAPVIVAPSTVLAPGFVPAYQFQFNSTCH